jgi:hypothetical protein
MHNSYLAWKHDSLSCDQAQMEEVEWIHIRTCVTRANPLVYLSGSESVCFENILLDVCVHADRVSIPVC